MKVLREQLKKPFTSDATFQSYNYKQMLGVCSNAVVEDGCVKNTG